MRWLVRPQGLMPQNLANLAWRNRVAGAGAHDLQDHALIDDHALKRPHRTGCFVGDRADIGGAIALQALDAPVGIFLPQRGEQRPARDQSALDRGNVAANFGGLVEHDLEEIRGPDITGDPHIRRRIDLRLGIADAARQLDSIMWPAGVR
jgi:hypothetical protein